MGPRLAWFGLLAACYAPQLQEGAPCTNDSECPIQQTCIAMACRFGLGSGSNMMPDGPMPDGSCMVDTDHDGIPDCMDNCPTIANPGQENKDGDKFGDVCDPCPIDPNNTDTDGDGVGDVCDPRPTMFGDKIVLFEGFYHGVPSGWTQIGTAQTATDGIRLIAPLNNSALLVAPMPMPPPTNGSITIGVVVESMGGSKDAGIGPALDWDPNQQWGIECDLYAPSANNPGQNYAGSLYDFVQNNGVGVELAAGNLKWSLNAPYRVSLTHLNNGYTCSVAPQPGTATVITGNSNSTTASPHVGFSEYSATTRVQYMLVVQSP
jgi:hypothetical protein